MHSKDFATDSLAFFKCQVHIGIGLEGVGCSHKDLLALATIQTMLGGGDSFSAGGPGKGLKSRIFVNVLYNQGVLSSSALNVSYSDTGIFGINATTTPQNTGTTIELIIKVPFPTLSPLDPLPFFLLCLAQCISRSLNSVVLLGLSSLAF